MVHVCPWHCCDVIRIWVLKLFLVYNVSFDLQFNSVHCFYKYAENDLQSNILAYDSILGIKIVTRFFYPHSFLNYNYNFMPFCFIIIVNEQYALCSSCKKCQLPYDVYKIHNVNIILGYSKIVLN